MRAANAAINNHQLLGNNNSLVIRNSSSQQAINQGKGSGPQDAGFGDKNQTAQDQETNGKQQSQGPMNSKSILSSFRNGPIKIIGNQSGSQQHISGLEAGQNQGDTGAAQQHHQHA
jgi:hypothetical protein